MLTEPRLRAERMLAMISPVSGAEVLLVGEREGLLAGLLYAKGAAGVTWLEPFACGDAPASTTQPGPGGPVKVIGDCARLPFEDRSFDRVSSQFTLETAVDPAGAMAEWNRVLKQGGRLSVLTSNALFRGSAPRPLPRERQRFGPSELACMVEAAGLAVLSWTTLLPDLKLPALYRGDLSKSLRLEGLPYLKTRGRLLLLAASKQDAGVAA